MKQSIRARIRAWLLRKLGAIDREEAETFAQQYLQPNGRAGLTIIASEATVLHRTIRVDAGQLGVAVAPWARNVTLGSLVFEPAQPAMRAIQADIIRRMREDLRPHLDEQALRLDAALALRAGIQPDDRIVWR